MKKLTILPGIISLAFLFSLPARAAYVCNPGPFLLPATYPAGTTQNGWMSIGKGDFDGDTHLDLVVLNQTGFSLLLGNGDGSFKAPAHFAGDQSFSSLAVGDLDGLGHLAVVAATYDHVFVYVSNGNGTFQNPVSFTRPSGGGPIALGDFDGDQKVDIVSGGGFGLISVFLGNGNGTFQVAVNTPLSFTPSSIALGDFDGDHKLDIAAGPPGSCCSSQDVIDVLLGNGAGGFGAPSSYASGGPVQSLVTFDIDMDNHMDIAASVGGFVSILINAGDGTFDAPQEYSDGAAQGPLLWDDFDNSGTPDLAALSPSSFAGSVGVSILGGTGDGGFQPARFYLLGGSAPAFVNGDFNEDGNVDLAVVTAPDRIAVMIGRGNGDFDAERLAPDTPSLDVFFPGPAALGDFDGDGIPDIVIGNLGAGPDAYLFPGDGDRGLGDPIDLQIGAGVLASADFNLDGHPDLVASPNGDTELNVYINDGLGNFAPSLVAAPFGVNILATGDFNGDGRADILAAPNFFDAADVFLGDGHGSFTDAGAITLGMIPTSVSTAAFNGDNFADILVIGQYDVRVMLGNGDGTFQAPSFSASISQASVAIADVNGDDKMDLVVASGGTWVSIYLGNGNGTFKAPVIIGLSYPAITVAAADFNRDGKMDIVVFNGGPGISVLMGKGNMTFVSPLELTGGGNLLVAFDLTGGSYPDLVSLGSAGIAVLRNSHVTVSRPPDAIACTNSTVHLAVHAAGRGTLTYQWRKNTVPLSDGGAILGSQEDTLTIQNPSPGDAGSYDVVVTDACGTATSDASTVTVQSPPADPVISAPLTVPPNTSGLIASAPFHAGDGYVWTPFFATIDGGQGTSQISFTSPGPGLQIHFTVVEMTAGGCESGVGTAAIQVDFLDVPPSNQFHDFIDALALHGVTFGCGNGDYCPDQTLPRDQMAAFIARAAVGTPPATGTIGAFAYDCDNGPSYFADVAAGSTFCAAIHYLASQSITLGCDSVPDFCPSELVTREQMALFIGRAIAPSATPPSSYSDGGTGRSYDCSIASPFTDVAANTESCNAIGYIWAKGIVDGFGDGTFHPLEVLTRAPTAKFIANAFGLTLGP